MASPSALRCVHVRPACSSSDADHFDNLNAGLGSLAEVHPGIVENLFASDLAFLQDLYRRVNQEGTSQVAVSCPACQHEFAIDLGADSLGGS